MGMAEKDEGKLEEGQAEVADLAPFDATKKKKKKKVTTQEAPDGSMGIDSLLEKVASLSVSEGLDTFAGLKKKKKRSTQISTSIDGKENLGHDGLNDNIKEDEEGEGIVLQHFPCEGTDRDYLHEELVDRFFNILCENNPMLAGVRRKTVMRSPQVLEGPKKTVFVNFVDLCKTMRRQPEHVMNFLLAELGTSGSLDGQQRLVVKGKFDPKSIARILDRYFYEYVMCKECERPDTILSKENRLFFLRCETCCSSLSVAPIKAGFVARVGRRKAGT